MLLSCLYGNRNICPFLNLILNSGEFILFFIFLLKLLILIFYVLKSHVLLPSFLWYHCITIVTPPSCDTIDNTADIELNSVQPPHWTRSSGNNPQTGLPIRWYFFHLLVESAVATSTSLNPSFLNRIYRVFVVISLSCIAVCVSVQISMLNRTLLCCICHVIRQPYCFIFIFKPSKIFFSEVAEQIEAKLYMYDRLSMRNKVLQIWCHRSHGLAAISDLP